MVMMITKFLEWLTRSKYSRMNLRLQKSMSIKLWDFSLPSLPYTSSLKNFTLKSFKMLILLVEDDFERMKELKHCFESSSVKVLSASDGTEALAILSKQKVDAIFSDMNMPYMS